MSNYSLNKGLIVLIKVTTKNFALKELEEFGRLLRKREKSLAEKSDRIDNEYNSQQNQK